MRRWYLDFKFEFIKCSLQMILESQDKDRYGIFSPTQSLRQYEETKESE